MDVLADILGSLRLTGGVVIDAKLTGDFCVRSEFTPQHFAPFFPTPETLVSYHYVRSGQMVVEVEGVPPVTVRAGEVAILPRNDPHLLESKPGLRPASADDIGWVTEEGVHRVASGSDGPPTEVWCGFLGTAKDSAHPLLDALPPLLTLDIEAGQENWLDSSMRFLAEEKPSQEVVARLAELFLTQAVREYLETLPAGAEGWLKGLADPAVSRALAIIHARYAEELTVDELARQAGVSRTVLGERFAELLGEPPMRYCARWRMRMAANMLRDGRHNTANVAYAVGFNSEAAFNRAFKREYGEPPATWRRRIEADEAAATAVVSPDLPEQTVRFCTALDGTRLAWSAVGDGPPLVKTANWLNHLEHDWRSPLWRHWMREFLNGHCLVRYDERANGLSDWETPEISLDAFVDDLACVVDAAALDRFDLLAISQGAAVAIAYAVRHPDRVRKLVICNGYAEGWAVRAEPSEVASREAMLTLTEVGWGSDNPAYRQVFTSRYVPGATQEQMDWFNEMQRQSASPKNAVRLQQVLGDLNVRDLLPRVGTPTLVLHSRDDHAVPYSQGELMAAEIPDAQFVPLDGSNHILLDSEPAWPAFTASVRSFLADGETMPPFVIRHAPKDMIRTCTASDGATLAYSVTGTGPPLVKAANWLNHLEADLASPLWRHWISALTTWRSVWRYDERGNGLSDWNAPLNFDAFVDDLESVVDAAGLDRFDLLGISQGAAVAIAYAVQHPERVRRMHLWGGYATGWVHRGDPAEVERREAMLELTRQGWALDNPAFRQMFTSLYLPEASQEQADWYNEMQRVTTSPANAEALQRVFGEIDVRHLLSQVTTPTLVGHSTRDAVVPFESGRALAARIPGAKFIAIESRNHLLLETDPGWPKYARVVEQFLT